MQVIVADGPGVESAEGNAQSSFYAFDFDRDGSVDLRLLVVPMDLDFALDDASLEGSQLKISGGETKRIDLVGFEGLTVEITGAAIDGGNVTGTVSVENGTVELIGLKRTRKGAEEVLIKAFDDDVDNEEAVASIILYVRVPNQLPKITFEHEDRDELRLRLPSGEFTTTLILDPTEGVLALAPNTETVLLVMIEDADGDEGFELVLTPEDGRGVANLVSRVMRTTDDISGDVIVHRLTLESTDARAPFKLTLTATDSSDGSSTPIELTVCVFQQRRPMSCCRPQEKKRRRWRRHWPVVAALRRSSCPLSGHPPAATLGGKGSAG